MSTPYEALKEEGVVKPSAPEDNTQAHSDGDDGSESGEDAAEERESEEERKARELKEQQARFNKWSTFGWKVNPADMFQMSFGNLEVVLDRIGEAIQQHEDQIHNPPWLGGIMEKLKQMDAMAEEIKELREQNTAMAAEIEGIKVDLEVDEDEDEDDGGGDAFEDGGEGEAEDGEDGPRAAASRRSSASGGGGRDVGGDGAGGAIARKTAKDVKQLKQDLAGVASQIGQAKRDMEKREQLQQMEATSKFSNLSMDVERLKRQLSTVASSNDWKHSMEQAAADTAELKRTLSMQTEETKRFLDGKMGEDLELSQRWREEVERSFNAQLKLMDERVAIIQDDVYQIRTGHGLELNELEDRFEEHLKTSEKSFGHVQADLKRLLKRSNDASDRLDASDAKHTQHAESFVAMQQHASEADARHDSMREEHGAKLEGLTDQMDQRVDEHEQVQLKLSEHDDTFANVQRQLTDEVGATLKAFAQKHAMHEQKEDDMAGELKKLKDEALPEVRADITALNAELKKLSETLSKTLNKFRTALEKTNTHITNTQKEVRAFDERITQNEETGASLQKECKALRDSLDANIESVRSEIMEVDKRCDEIEVLRKTLAAKSELIAECQGLLDEHRHELDEAKQSHENLVKHCDDMRVQFDQSIEDAETRIREDVSLNASGISELRKEGEHRDRAIFNLATKVDENERIAEMHRQPEAEMRLWMEELVKLDVEFEQDAVPEKAPRLSKDMAKTMARHAQDLAGYFASQADFEVINQYVGAGDAEELNFDEEQIDMMRHSMTEDFLVQLIGDVQAANPRPTKVMLEARAKFKNKLRKAIESALTKHEQVEIAGNSRLLGRSLKPTCVACDRPLHTRRRVKDGPSGHTGARPATSHGGGGAGGRERGGSNAAGARGDIPGRSGGHPGEYLGGESRPAVPAGGSEYVYRGGFRMPKQTPEADIYELAEGGGGSIGGGGGAHVGALPRLGAPGSKNQLPEQLMSRTMPGL